MSFRRSTVPGEDIRLAMEITQRRREQIDRASAGLPKYDYGVNRLSRALHPGTISAVIENKKACGTDTYRITLRSKRSDGRFPCFRAGQFVTLSKQVNGSFLSRPYSISSSPNDALRGIIELIVQRQGIFSTYLIEKAESGEEITVGEPSGDFYHDDIRDRGHVLAVAGGSGITPFLSMMKALKEGSEEFRLTLLYGVKNRAQMVFDPQEYEDERICIIPVLSEEQAEGYHHGFISAEILEGYLNDHTSVFMCGPDAMYAYVTEQLVSLGFDPSRIRREHNSIKERTVAERKTVQLRVHIRDELFCIEAANNETIVTALERAGIASPVRCRSGACGFCHSRVISGQYTVAAEHDFRRAADKKFNYIHACAAYPDSDLEIDVPFCEKEE